MDVRRPSAERVNWAKPRALMAERFSPDDLERDSPDDPPKPWELYAIRFSRSAQAAGFNPTVANGLMAALYEMTRNALEHAESPHPAFVGYQAEGGVALFCVADVGRGVLASLRSCKDYSALTKHDGAADEFALVADWTHRCFLIGSGPPPLKRARAVGPLDPVQKTTLTAVIQFGPVTGAELERKWKAETVKATAWNNRLRDLYDKRLIRKERRGGSRSIPRC